jgi:hypothetical protein
MANFFNLGLVFNVRLDKSGQVTLQRRLQSDDRILHGLDLILLRIDRLLVSSGYYTERGYRRVDLGLNLIIKRGIF